MSLIKKSSYSHFFRILIAFILAFAMVFLSGGEIQTSAVTGIWTGAFSNIWNHTQNWMPWGYPNASGEIAIFDGGDVPTNVVISKEQVTVGGLVIMNNIGYTISQESGGGLIF